MTEFKRQLAAYSAEAEEAIGNICNGWSFQPPVLNESMRYGLLVGGKRIRPVLFYATLDGLGIDRRQYDEFAVALELIHTYSLIHDDLPAMDNADLRRGKPSAHKVFGEANAVLAGDALLNTAYQILFDKSAEGENVLKASSYLCRAAGADGMISGQSADILYTASPDLGEKELLFVDERKTARLITAPIVCAAILARKDILPYERLGKSLGMLFQIVDDILDEIGDEATVGKPLGKDEENKKLTFPSIYGVEGAKREAERYAEESRNLLTECGLENQFMNGLIEYFLSRRK